MNFQSFTKHFFGNPAAVFFGRIIFYSLELYLLLILVTKAAFLISVTFDNFFTSLLESIFSLFFDNFFSDNLSALFSDNDSLNALQQEIEVPTVWNHIGNYLSIFYNHLKDEPNALLKITMIFKALILFSFVFLLFYHILSQSFKALRYKWVLLIVLKVLVIFMFLLVAAANFLALLDSGSFFNYGTLFSFNMVRSCFSQQKLLILVVFFTAARDVLLHAVSVMKK